MDIGHLLTLPNLIAALLVLAPFLCAAFFGSGFVRRVRSLSLWLRLAAPATLSVPYVLVTCAAGCFHWGWFVVYALFPVVVAILLWQADCVDNRQIGTWRDFLVLVVLGLAVDLRWFEGAWPVHLASIGKMLLMDAAIYGFIGVRQLDGVGFDLRLHLRDAAIGLRELVWYAPIALVLGLGMGFLHLHRTWPGFGPLAGAWIYTFFLIAVPEELFFRGWLQNLLERRLGRLSALAVTAILFGLSHFNKRAAHFNWRYVLLAALAGVFYGRAWRHKRRVGASAITHASVDTIWSLWLQ
jgi:hypothetical protein